MEKTGRLYLIRHGQSHWNKSGRFTGCVDIGLSTKGVQEALEAGRYFAEKGISIDCCYVSSLSRALLTAQLFLTYGQKDRESILIKDPVQVKHVGDESIAIYERAQLNERSYGNLQGDSKEEAKKRFGEDTVQKWRRSYEGVPPGGESLQQTATRVLKLYREEILPRVKNGEQVLICAHGNSLRALVMDIEGLSSEEVVALEIPTGKVLSYEYLKEAKAQALPEYQSGFSRVK